jgi:hypothetical protein
VFDAEIAQAAQNFEQRIAGEGVERMDRAVNVQGYLHFG